MTRNRYPKGWNAARVKRVIDYYESQTDAEAAAEDDAAFAARDTTLMEVPTELAADIAALIARRQGRSRRRSVTSKTTSRRRAKAG